MRMIVALLFLTVVFATSSVSAVELVLVGRSASGAAVINVGEDITIELRMTNASQSHVFGLGASVHGYEDGLSFISGRAVRRYLNDGDSGFLSNLAGTASGGTGFALQRVLAENRIASNPVRVC